MHEGNAGDLLRTMLPMAVYLNVPNFQQRPWSELQKIATEASQYIAEKGDNILFKSKKKGDTAKAFNELAKGVAILSFAPGGVKLFGMHFENVHPDQIHAGRWLYHSAMADMVPAIAKDGLVPEQSGKVFFAGLVSLAATFQGMVFVQNLAQEGWSWDPVILRAHSAHLGDIEKDSLGADDWYVEREVPAVFIQIWVPELKAWTEVREAAARGYFTEAKTQMGRPGKIAVPADAPPVDYAKKYIDQFWPTYE